jgi:uncharacterized protein YdeI (YjbR/CyaY-like superfamily)
MTSKQIETLDIRTRREWRKWLSKHHATTGPIWLVFHKQHTGESTLAYDDAVEEALCYGWIDSIVRRLDEDRFARKFTPRNADSRWSLINRRRYADLEARGLLAPPGKARAPGNRIAVPPPRLPRPLPVYMEKALRRVPRAWRFFNQLAPSYQRHYIGWVDSAKREETKERRLREAVSLLAAEKKLGLK